MGVGGPYGIFPYETCIEHAPEDTPAARWKKKQRLMLKEFCESVYGVYDDWTDTCAIDTRNGLLLMSIGPQYYQDGSKVVRVRVLFRYDRYPAVRLRSKMQPNAVYGVQARAYELFIENYSTAPVDYICLSAFSGINKAKKDKHARALSICVVPSDQRDAREAIVYLNKDDYVGANVREPSGRPRRQLEVHI